MTYPILNGADIDFPDRELWWKTYITKEAFPTIKCVKLVEKKEFTAAALDSKYEIFLVYIKLFNSSSLINIDIYPSCKF